MRILCNDLRNWVKKCVRKPHCMPTKVAVKSLQCIVYSGEMPLKLMGGGGD